VPLGQTEGRRFQNTIGGQGPGTGNQERFQEPGPAGLVQAGQATGRTHFPGNQFPAVQQDPQRAGLGIVHPQPPDHGAGGQAAHRAGFDLHPRRRLQDQVVDPGGLFRADRDREEGRLAGLQGPVDEAAFQLHNSQNHGHQQGQQGRQGQGEITQVGPGQAALDASQHREMILIQAHLVDVPHQPVPGRGQAPLRRGPLEDQQGHHRRQQGKENHGDSRRAGHRRHQQIEQTVDALSHGVHDM